MEISSHLYNTYLFLSFFSFFYLSRSHDKNFDEDSDYIFSLICPICELQLKTYYQFGLSLLDGETYGGYKDGQLGQVARLP